MSANQLFKRAFLRKRFSDASAAKRRRAGVRKPPEKPHAKFAKYAKF